MNQITNEKIVDDELWEFMLGESLCSLLIINQLVDKTWQLG